VLGATLVAAFAGSLRAQVGDCEILPGTDEARVAGDISFIRRARLACPEGMRVSADSLMYHQSLQLYELFGNASFDNAEIGLRARDARFYNREARITAQGNVVLRRKEDGSSVTGENLVLLQKNDQRPNDELTVTGGRPHAVLRPKPREGEPSDTVPFEVDAERIVMRGEEMEASGSVELRRGELEGSGQDMTYIGTPGQLLLRGEATLLTTDYDLAGGLILLQMPNGEVEEVTAREGATLKSQQLEFEAPQIYFVLQDGELERLVGGRDPAWVPADSTARVQPIAIAENFTIRGDSLEVTAPGGVLESVVAIGRAHATSTAGDLVVTDLSPEVAREDWIRGDTILADFAAPEPDTTSTPEAGADTNGEEEFRLERLRARSNARAFYRMPVEDSTRTVAADTLAPAAPGDSLAPVAPADSVAVKPEAPKDCIAFHHVTGNAITIFMEEGTVTSMQVEGQVAGQHWEPPCATRTTPPSAPTPAVTPGSPSPPLPGPPPPPPPAAEVSARPRLVPTRSSGARS
jgi:lipopolysaccharide export system protein LptA